MLDIYEKIITKDPVAALDELTENAAIYAGIILNKTDTLSDEQRESYLDLQRVQGAPSYLFIMYLIKHQESLGVTDEDVVKICKLLVNFFIRRNLTDTPPTRDLTRIFMSFIEAIEQNEYEASYTNTLVLKNGGTTILTLSGLSWSKGTANRFFRLAIVMVKRVCNLPTRISASAPSIFVKEGLSFFGDLSVQNLFDRLVDQSHIRRAIPANNICKFRSVCSVFFCSERSSLVMIGVGIFLQPVREVQNDILVAAWDRMIEKPSQLL